MNGNVDIRDVEVWRTHLGVLPVPLRDISERDRYVMMNGAQGNFCLDVSEDRAQSSGAAFRSIAWSSDVGYYLRLGTQNARLYRWDTDDSVDVNVEDLGRGLEAFQRFLEENEPLRQLSVVAHATQVYMSLRSHLGAASNGLQALRCFFVLLACAKAGLPPEKLDLVEWGIHTAALDDIRAFSPAAWDTLIATLKNPPQRGGLEMLPDLTLRHAAGQVFQEAHYAVEIPQSEQLTLDIVARPPSRRSGPPISAGIYFTPPAIARTVVEQSIRRLDLNRTTLKIFDPACGSGEFLREALQQLESHGFTGYVELIGWDISENASEMAQFALSRMNASRTVAHTLTIEPHDSLDLELAWPRNVDLILMNPPFVSWWDLNQSRRKQLLQLAGGLVRAKPDLSSAFLIRSMDSLEAGGVLGSVVPTSTLDTDSTEPLRHSMGKSMVPNVVARLGNLGLFASATIDAAILVMTMDDKPATTTMLWTDQRSRSVSAGLRALRAFDGDAIDRGSYSLYQVPAYISHRAEQQFDDWAPRPYKAFSFLQRQNKLPRVTEVFRIGQGVATGYKSAFVLSAAQYETLPERERRYFRPAVVNDSIVDGILRPKYYLFYPYEGTEVLLDTAELFEKRMRNYLTDFVRPHYPKLTERKGIGPEKWWLLMRPRPGEANRTPKIVSTYYGQAGSFAYDSSGDYVAVQGLSWRVPAKYQVAMERELGYVYLAVLNSEAFELLLTATSRRTGGGQIEIAKRFLQKTPIPNLFELDVAPDTLRLMADAGRAISSAKFPLSRGVESLVKTLFD